MTHVEIPPQKRVSGESRQSTRVRLKVGIEAQGIGVPLTCEGETVVVNLHGAMIVTDAKLSVGLRIAYSCHSDGQACCRQGCLRRS